MSLELAIEKNTEALNRLIAALGNQNLPISPPLPVADGRVFPADPVTDNPGYRPPVDIEPPPKAKAAKPKAEPAPAAPAAPAVEITYTQVAAAITAFAARNGREAALGKLAALGVKSGKELKPEQFAAALEAFS